MTNTTFYHQEAIGTGIVNGKKDTLSHQEAIDTGVVNEKKDTLNCFKSEDLIKNPNRQIDNMKLVKFCAGVPFRD